ncbi:hypothetical protein MPH_00121 [Macrophomina phaseolina MS6]|uniref:Uncharacterized protein n=1 Tax=Macrophomina phaseolina (strain MS6) TaxID=1126212 RepID=K2S6S6_MACPH|nr:hypothetical protein MPH_00121 [Macrophomina phaseolina MS6]
MLSDLRRYSRKRSVWLFAYGALAISYVLAIPTLFSTMTGYISASTAFTKVPGTSQFVPTSFFQSGYIFYNLEGIRNNTCLSNDEVSPASSRQQNQFNKCNSTCITHNYTDYRSYSIWKPTGEKYRQDSSTVERLFYSSDCSFFTNETYYDDYGSYIYQDSSYFEEHNIPKYNCNDTVNIAIGGKNFSIGVILNNAAYDEGGPRNWDTGYCYNNTGYTYSDISDNGRCLPDTENEAAYVSLSLSLPACLPSSSSFFH